MPLRQQLVITVLNSAGEPYPLNYFVPKSPVCFYRDWNNEHLFLQPLTGDLYWRISTKGTLEIGGEFLRINDQNIVRIFGGFVPADDAVTLSGSWTSTYNYASFARQYHYGVATNAYAEFVSDSGVTEIGLQKIGNGNGGPLVLVAIDGDTTMADLLPTAQDYVDGATFPDTILVANGGTLNPTDRCYDTNAYGGRDVWFSRSLAAGSHTVRITNTGYKTAGSANTAMFFCAFVAFGSGLYGFSQPYIYFDEYQNQVSGETADEVSWAFQPSGTSATNWLGHTGSLKFTELPTYTMDGVNQTPAYLDRYVGNSMMLTMQFDVRHDETGETSHGLFDMIYEMTASGLSIRHSVAWSGTGTVYGYPCLMAIDRSVMDTGGSSAGSALLNNAGTVKLNNSNDKIWSFDADGNQAKIMYIPSMAKTVNNWSQNPEPGQRLFWLDTIPKAYATRIFSTSTVDYNNSTVFESEAIYRTAWLDDTGVLAP